MWKYCDNNSLNAEIKFSIEDGFLSVKSEIPKNSDEYDIRLYACFNESAPDFLIGNYTFCENKYLLNKKYSLSYLDSCGTDYKNLSCFIIEIPGKTTERVYPCSINYLSYKDDIAFTRAKKLLESPTDPKNSGFNDDIINKLKYRLLLYKKSEIFVMRDYTWHEINDYYEDFGLSSVRHILNSENFSSKNGVWYFGISPTDRLFAIGVNTLTENVNPLSNADDCTTVFKKGDCNEYFFAVGILLLDDGQYFCRL